ncbi:hypothetical protein C8F01DRAFT_1084006 [Mycena amicta]|nr:hypothetical protein C8F01DRAFT_1084006 [Mycena amicta]
MAYHHVPSQQNAIDMTRAREATSINMVSVCNFIQSKLFATRKERYIRGQARMLELQEIHAWSAEELNVAWASLDDGLPIGLHNIGANILLPVSSVLTSNDSI